MICIINLFNFRQHAWVSFEGFAESWADAFQSEHCKYHITIHVYTLPHV